METGHMISLPKELPHQRPVLLSPARFKLAANGRRWGKTVTGLLTTIEGHGPQPGALKGAIDGARIWWVASTNEAARDIIWPDLRRACEGCEKNEQGKTIWLPGGGSIAVKSAEAEDSLRGPGLDGVVCDEIAHWKERVWKEIIRPMLSDKQGWALHISTPNGKNWWYDLFESVPKREGWERWQLPTSDNPLISARELEDAKLDLGLRAYLQEYEARFTEQEGAEWPGDYFPESMWFDNWLEAPRSEIECRVGYCDPSKGKSEKSDYSAIIWVAKDRMGTYWVKADIERRPVDKIARDCVSGYREFKADRMGIEAVGFQELLAKPIEQEAVAQGVYDGQVVPMLDNTKKEVRIRRLTGLLSRGRIRIFRDRGGKLLMGQLQAFPIDDHDDGPDALEGAIRLCEQTLAGEIAPERKLEERLYA